MKLFQLCLAFVALARPAFAAAPVAGNDEFILTPSSSPAVLDVRANDSDGDSDPLTITEVTQGQFGDVTTDGASVTYTARPGFPGADAFTYTISDFNGSPVATGNVEVTGDPIEGGAHIAFRQGDTVPGAPTFRFLSFGTPAVNAGGVLAFTATIGGRSVTELDRDGVFSSTASLAQEFETAPGYGANATEDVFTGDFGAPQINVAGDVLFTAKVRLKATNKIETGLFLARGAQRWRVAVTSELALGRTETLGLCFDQGLLPDGRVVFTSLVKGVSSKNFIWLWKAGEALTLLAAEGETIDLAAAGDPSELAVVGDYTRPTSPSENRGHSRWLAAGRVLYRAVVKPDKVNVEVLLDLLAPADERLLFRSDTPAPDDTDTRIFNTFHPAWSDPAQDGAVFLGKRKPIPPATLPKAGDLLYDTATGEVLAVGDLAPDVPSATFAKFSRPVAADNRYAFQASLKPRPAVPPAPAITTANDVCLYQQIGAAPILVAREGAQVDHGGTLAPYFKSFTTFVLPEDASVGVLFRGVLGNPPRVATVNRVTAANDEGVWVADSLGVPRLLIREGFVLPALPALGPVKKFAALTDTAGTARSHAGERFAAWVQTLVPGDTFLTQSLIVLPLAAP